MTGGEQTLFKKVLNGLLKLEKSDGVCDRGAILAGTLRHLLLRQMEFFCKSLECLGLLNWVEILALQVLDKGHFHGPIIGDIANYHGNLWQLGALGGTPAAFPGNQFIAVTQSANEQRLNDPAGTDGLRKLFERLFAEVRPGLVWTRVDQVDVDLQ